jgi:hypothetical protein
MEVVASCVLLVGCVLQVASDQYSPVLFERSRDDRLYVPNPVDLQCAYSRAKRQKECRPRMAKKKLSQALPCISVVAKDSRGMPQKSHGAQVSH